MSDRGIIVIHLNELLKDAGLSKINFANVQKYNAHN